MAVILVPPTGNDWMINWWNWRPLVAMLIRAGILPEGDRAERCLSNGCGGYLSQVETTEAAEYVESLLRDMREGERMLLDGTQTDIPKDYTLPIDEWTEDETRNRYSVSVNVLQSFAEFCRRSGGFEVL